MLARERLELCVSGWRELKVDLPVVGFVSGSLDQAGGLGALGELDGAMVADVQIVGDVADRRAVFACVAANYEQQLVKRWCEAGCSGGVFAPSCEGS